MNITEEKTGELTATLKLEVVESDYAAKILQELKEYRRKATMPGFRPGKIPMDVIRKKYGMAVLLDEVNKFVSDQLNNYIKENKLNLLGFPLSNGEKEPQDFHRQKDFNFYFDIAYAPEIELKLDTYQPVDYLTIAVDDKKLDEQIGEMKTRYGKAVEQEEILSNDMVHVQIDELAEDGNLKQGGISNSTMLLANFLKDEEVQKQFLGLKVGDITKLNPLKATGSEAETASMLGIEKDKVTVLTSDFQFEITKIERNVPAELGEELYKLVYPKEEIKTEEEFRAKVKEEISKAYEIETERLFSRYAMDRLFDDTEINLPEEFLKKWLYASNEGKVTTEEIEKSYHGYSKAMKMELIENTLIKANSSLKVTDEDLKAEIKNYFRGYLMPDQAAQQEEDPGMAEQIDLIADNYLKKNKKESQRIHDEIFSNRLAGFLKNEMKLNKKEVLYDEFVEVVSKVNAQSHDHDHHDHHDHEVHSEHE